MAQAIQLRTTSRMPAPQPALSSLEFAHIQLIAAVAGEKPYAIVGGMADPVDIEDRRDHLQHLLEGVAAYLKTALNDLAENVSGGASDTIRKAINIFEDASHDLIGEIAA